MTLTQTQSSNVSIAPKILRKAYQLMITAKKMAEIYEENRDVCQKYVHSTSRGHEAIQLAAAFQLKPQDYASVYYRDESILLGIGITPYELMLQLMAKGEDPFSGGRTYYCHPSLKRKGFPTIPHQSSATGMQAIPATGMAQAIQYLEQMEKYGKEKPLVLCSMGDGAVTEGEVSEAFQMAALKQLPIIYLVQDNRWAISAKAEEIRAMDAFEFAAGFKGIERMRVNGTNFLKSHTGLKKAFNYVRKKRKPLLVHADCPLLGHHTSGVRKEWYRDQQDLETHGMKDPIPILRKILRERDIDEASINKLERETARKVDEAFNKAKETAGPDPATITDHVFFPTPIVEETGKRRPKDAEKVVMVDAALHAIDEILADHPEALFYGQDVGGRLGGVFREAVNLAKTHGNHRVFNTPIQEAYIIGSTVGMCAVGCKPIVEIQFADYLWPGINQLAEELSKSCYLSLGQFPVQALIRIPTGAYGGGGPYHSGNVESALVNLRGIKVVYPSNAADMKGLIKSSFFDPNPVVMLEHKGLYWSKLKGTEEAKNYEPDKDYIIPLGVANRMQLADKERVEEGSSALIITYGMGVYWARQASKAFSGQLEIIDLRTLNPIDWNVIGRSIKLHNKAMILTEEPILNSFSESLAGRISESFFQSLDAPIMTLGSENLPAVPLNTDLENAMLPSAEKVKKKLQELLGY